MVGPTSGEPLTFGGCLLIHDNRDELEWLVPGIRVVPLTDSYGLPTMRLQDHPDLAHLTWPLERKEFRP